MHPTTASTAAEQHARARLDDIGIFDLINDPCFADAFAEHAPAHRNRLYTPARTLAMFVSQALSDDRSVSANESASFLARARSRRSPRTPQRGSYPWHGNPVTSASPAPIATSLVAGIGART